MFKINGDNWRVVFVSPYHPMLKKKDGSYTLGACVDDTKKIYINNKLSLEKIKKVLCHEITHAAMFSYDIQLTYDQEELLTDLLATYGQEVIDITNKIFSKIKKRGDRIKFYPLFFILLLDVGLLQIQLRLSFLLMKINGLLYDYHLTHYKPYGLYLILPIHQE